MKPTLTIEVSNWEEIKFLAEAILEYSKKTGMKPNEIFKHRRGVRELIELASKEYPPNDKRTKEKSNAEKEAKDYPTV